MNVDKTGQDLGEMLIELVKSEKIMMKINDNYEPFRINQQADGLCLYDVDGCLKKSLAELTNAITHIKQGIDIINGE